MKISALSKASLLALLLGSANIALSEQSVESLQNLSEELVKVRQEISTLHDAINFEKNKYNDQIRAFAAQKSDLKVKIGRADLNQKELEQELEKLKAATAEQSKPFDAVASTVRKSITAIRKSVKRSLPFKLNDRINALDEIELRLNTGVVTPNKAANQLWAFIEDELVLGRSSGIYNESLEIDGQEKLVKVLRMGKVAMFYKSNEGEYGVIRRVKKQWQQEAISNVKETSQLDQLFDSFAKNIRSGQFTLPNYLPQG